MAPEQESWPFWRSPRFVFLLGPPQVTGPVRRGVGRAPVSPPGAAGPQNCSHARGGAGPGRFLSAREERAFPARLGWAGLASLVRLFGRGHGRGKRLNDSHGQVRKNLLEGDASCYTRLARR